MYEIYLIAAFWFLAALVSTIIANRIKISMALMEIIIGAVIGYAAFKLGFFDSLSLDADWMKFCAGVAAIMLTFLAGSELNPDSLKAKFKEITLIGLTGFFAPFAGAALVAYFLLGWDLRASLLTGIALSTTSMAVVYSVMLEYGLNKTIFGKSLLGSCFINDLGTVIGLGLIFAPFTFKTLIFVAAIVLLIIFLPRVTNYLTDKFGHKTAAIRTKWILFVLISMAVLAIWSGSEPVLPALIAAPLIFLVLFAAKISFKIFGLYPVIRRFKKHNDEKWYYTLLMSTGLTFGTISALYGLTNNIITRDQYSFIVGTVIASAVIPTLIANKFFLPKHLLSEPVPDDQVPEVPAGRSRNN